MKELIKILDGNLEYERHDIERETIRIYVKSTREAFHCAYCGEASGKVHSRNIRKLQDLPISGKKTIVALERRKFFCMNPECDHKTFAETFEFFGAMSRKTNRLQDEILRVSLTQSAVSASKYLRRSVANVGKSTICNMLKKEIRTAGLNEKVKAICIDDFALKKRQRYGTLMVDADSVELWI